MNLVVDVFTCLKSFGGLFLNNPYSILIFVGASSRCAHDQSRDFFEVDVSTLFELDISQ